MNVDEMETQPFLVPGPTVPAIDPPACLAMVTAALTLNPPVVDATRQYKKNFKSMLDQKKKGCLSRLCL